MRTTCPKCKRGALILIKDSIHHRTTTYTTEERVLVSSWGYFDRDGHVVDEDSEENAEEVDSNVCVEDSDEHDEESCRVECENCGFVVPDHPLASGDTLEPTV